MKIGSVILVIWLVIGALAVDLLQGLEAVVGARPSGLDLRDVERRMPGHGDPGHLQAIRDTRLAAGLVRRLARHDEPDTVQTTRLTALLGQDQVSQMDRVERASEKPQAHGFMT